MDTRAVTLLLCAAALAFFIWRAQVSGEITMRFSTVRRDNNPLVFQAAYIVRIALVVIATAGALAVILRWV